jgi:surface antigen
MNRELVFGLRRVAGGSAILALGFAVISSSGQKAPVTVAAAAPVKSMAYAWPAIDQLPQRIGRPTAVADAAASAKPTAVALAPKQVRTAVRRPATAKPAVAAPAAAAPSPAAPAPPVVVQSGGNPANSAHYDFGYCVWWVAHKRYIPWQGQAAQWWWLARKYGFAEGQTPRPGAVMVMAGGGAAFGPGHVAYVESVNGDGSFVISEMNWYGVPGGGFGRVDYRTVRSMRGILGFIY